MKKLKLFTDWDYKPSTQTYPAFIIQPPWQARFGEEADLKDKSEFREVNRFGSLLANWHKYFESTDNPNNADYIVLPSDWKYYIRERETQAGLEFLSKMAEFKKRIIIQYNSDDDKPLDFQDIDQDLLVIARTSLNKSRRRSNEYPMPGFVGDPLVVYGQGNLQLREKQDKPKVGFCGWAKKMPLTEQELEDFCLLVDKGLSDLDLNAQADLIYSFRGTVLNFLQQGPNLKNNFIFRNGYCGSIDRDKDNSGLLHVRQQFYNNIIDSDYVVCIRGKGNYSYRFYETLAFGRIPIFVSTDSPLPFQDSIDWRNHCVQVEHRNIKNICEIVSAHYASLSPDKLLNLQIENRSLWESMLVPEKYFANLLTKLSSEVPK